ncbi:hypothetical protein AB0I81_17770 [Nonomuraea sp. NPDC050404]|uniref:helix-turn-helix transcriptional regulator n=1 Tax=Nonomuraea sp. NPDC050404 TaxID=3155783 RepID=UPI00340C1CE9
MISDHHDPHLFPVAIIDPLPAYAVGLVSAFAEAGFSAECPTDPPRWTERHDRSAVVITMDPPCDEELLQRLVKSDPELWITVLVTHPRLSGLRHFWGMGVHSVVDRMTRPQVIVRTVELTMASHAVVPMAIFESIAEKLLKASDIDLSEQHVAWLEALGRGARISDIAQASGYSIREMHRLLGQLYRTLGVSGRFEAIALAARSGII